MNSKKVVYSNLPVKFNKINEYLLEVSRQVDRDAGRLRTCNLGPLNFAEFLIFTQCVSIHMQGVQTNASASKPRYRIRAEFVGNRT